MQSLSSIKKVVTKHKSYKKKHTLKHLDNLQRGRLTKRLLTYRLLINKLHITRTCKYFDVI